MERVAVVTGAANGLGFAIAQRLAIDGCNVVVAERNAAGAKEAAGSIVAAGLKALYAQAGVSQPDSVSRLVDGVMVSHDKLDIMVSNSGVGWLFPFLDLPFESWQQTLVANLDDTFLCGRAAGKAMRAQEHETIVNIASGQSSARAPAAPPTARPEPAAST